MKTFFRIAFLVLIVVGFGWLFFYLLKGASIPGLPENQNILPIKIGGVGNLSGTVMLGNGLQKTSSTEASSSLGQLLTKVSNGAIFDYAVVSDDEIYYFSD